MKRIINEYDKKLLTFLFYVGKQKYIYIYIPREFFIITFFLNKLEKIYT